MEIFLKKKLINTSEKNIFFDTVEFCPHHQDAKVIRYKKNCKFRKPGNLMIEKLFNKWFIKKKRHL